MNRVADQKFIYKAILRQLKCSTKYFTAVKNNAKEKQ